MFINFSDYTASQRYHLMTQTIIPRPIAWVLTESVIDGNTSLNLAPFSYFSAVSSEPALLMLSVGKKPNGEFKDTLTNALTNKKMVIHIANEKQASQVTKTAASLPHGVSELSHNIASEGELTTVPFDGFALPRLKECDIAYGCELYETKTLAGAGQTLIFVEIKQLYLNPDKISLVDDRLTIHADAIQPLARLGANEYAGISRPFTAQRPK